jgi:hypothetical protein
LRITEGEPSMGDWTWCITGDFRGIMSRECTWLPAIDISKGFCPQAALNWRSCIEASGVTGKVGI